MPDEDSDDAVAFTMPLGDRQGCRRCPTDPLSAALARIHESMAAKARRSDAGSTLQLAAFQSAVGSATVAGDLRAWLAERRA